ncbi:SDR family oxidoreductase [Vibrio sp. 1-Bac 57]
MKKIIITGANGFVGSALYKCLQETKSFFLLQTARFNADSNLLNIDFSVDFNIENELNGVDVVIHCAARVHVMNDTDSNPLDAFRAVNTNGTLNLAQQAANAGVKRFIFISSIKVNGESTALGFPFKPDDDFIPTDPYGLSKYEAEVGLRKIAEQTGMEVVIIRPPLVYGPGVKANFASMMKWMNKGLPLPLGGIKSNKRSLVSVDNLVDLIITCIKHPNAANQIFLVSDDEDISTSELLSNMAAALEVSNRLLPVPSLFFALVAKLIGKPAISLRLCGSLQVDISKTKELLNWQPPYSAAECMKKTADTFLENNSK